MSRFVRGCSIVGLFASLFIAACNTVEGAGRDVEDAGEAVQDAAD